MSMVCVYHRVMGQASFGHNTAFLFLFCGCMIFLATWWQGGRVSCGTKTCFILFLSQLLAYFAICKVFCQFGERRCPFATMPMSIFQCCDGMIFLLLGSGKAGYPADLGLLHYFSTLLFFFGIFAVCV